MPKSQTSKNHPESLDEVKSVKANSEIETFVSDLSGQVETEKDNRSRWEQAVDRLNRLRFGARRRKNHPWPGAANYIIPLIDARIEKIKPSYVNLAFSVSPIVTFEPFGPEDVEPARKRELLFDWRMRTQIKFFKPYCYGVDHILGSPGMTVFRTIWKFSSRKYTVSMDLDDMDDKTLDAIFDARVDDETLARGIQEQFDIDISYEENEDEIKRAVEKFRKGDTKIELNLFETAEDRPEVTACDVAQDLVVPIDTKDLNDARFIDYKFWVTKNDLKISMNDNKYLKHSDETIDSWGGKSPKKTTTNNFKTVDIDDELILLHETCCWYDIDGDGIEERCIVTWPDASPKEILRFIELPYDHGMWPYVQVKRELLNDWFYSTRGYPSLDEDFQKGISTAVNQAIDNGTLVNQPERVARKGVISNPRNRRFLPGEFTETNGSISEYETRQHPNISQPGLFQQAQFLKSWSDQRSPNSGQSFSNAAELPGLGQQGQKTKFEVQAQVGQQAQAQSLDLQVFQQQMAVVYYQIDALYNQFGSDEEEIQITGQPPLRVSRDEVQAKFNIVPNGRLDNATPQARLQKKMFAFQIGFGNPFVKQNDLIREIFEDIDSRLAKLVLKSAEELAQEAQQSIEQAQQAEQEGMQKSIGLRKLSDDMDVRKELLMVPIHGRKFAPK